MTTSTLTQLVLSKLEGDERISDIVSEAIQEAMEELDLDMGSEDGYDLMMDTSASISLVAV
jgi:hypothetical protein